MDILRERMRPCAGRSLLSLSGGGIQDAHEVEESYEVSILFCEYNAQWEKIKISLDSFLRQEGIRFQVVVTDDGSENSWFKEIREYFAAIGFTDYILTALRENQGTVKNLLNGIRKCRGKLVKTLSPGDCLKEETSLRRWADALTSSGKGWSFAEAVYYSVNKQGGKEYVSVEAHPQVVKPYLQGNERKCRWNYVAFGDIALGAACLAERSLCLSYLERIDGKVKYAEDNIFRIMMFDGCCGYYYPEKTVLYEYGAGISTGGSDTWRERLQDDWRAADRLMEENMISGDIFQAKMLRAVNAAGCVGRLSRFLTMPHRVSYLLYQFRVHVFARKTWAE